MGKLDGKVALVTGAGSPTGIGFGCARALAEAGASVALTATAQERADAQAARLRAEGFDATGIVADVGREDSVRAMIEETVAKFGALDILVNNAAAGAAMAHDGSVTELTVPAWDETMAINVRGPMLAARHAIPLMLKRGGGAIVNISSQGAKTASHHAAYGASKAALDNLTLNIAFSHGKQGIRANAIAPGIIVSREMPESFLAQWRAQTLTPYLGEPRDIGALVVFLASDDARYITGQIIAADGGILSHATWTSIQQW